MRKVLFTGIIVLFLMGLVACGGDSPTAAMDDMLVIFDDYISGMGKAENADDVVAVIETFSAGILELTPRMKALQEKHPELQSGMKGGKMPEEFKEYEEKFKELMPKFMGVMGKMMQYAKDPKVQEAQKKMKEAMASFK
jgi:hypothetical protein